MRLLELVLAEWPVVLDGELLGRGDHGGVGLEQRPARVLRLGLEPRRVPPLIDGLLGHPEGLLLELLGLLVRQARALLRLDGDAVLGERARPELVLRLVRGWG